MNFEFALVDLLEKVNQVARQDLTQMLPVLENAANPLQVAFRRQPPPDQFLLKWDA